MDKITKLIKELGLDDHIPYEIQQDEILLGIFKKGLETIMEGEMGIHLGYPKNNRSSKALLNKDNNKRNGYRYRPLDTSAGRINDLKEML